MNIKMAPNDLVQIAETPEVLRDFSPEEIRVILDDVMLTAEDYPILARLRAMSREELASYDLLNFSDSVHYNDLHRHWMKREGYFVAEKLRQKLGREPTHAEYEDAFADKIIWGDDSERFRAYYALRYPDKVSGHRHLDLPASLRSAA
jgi:hypothetical protein